MIYYDSQSSIFFFFNDTATTEIYTLSLHDALPICYDNGPPPGNKSIRKKSWPCKAVSRMAARMAQSKKTCILHGKRSEEHTSELQSQSNLVCRLLLEKKKKT